MYQISDFLFPLTPNKQKYKVLIMFLLHSSNRRFVKLHTEISSLYYLHFFCFLNAFSLHDEKLATLSLLSVIRPKVKNGRHSLQFL